ncbi:MAG: hypothetical protein WCY90_00150 [Bacilli bacterium]
MNNEELTVTKTEDTNIAERIRKTLLHAELRYMQAETQMLVANEDYKKYSALGGVTNQRKAQKANIKVRVLTTYMENVKAIKSAAVTKLNTILESYTDKYKIIFVMYFIERRAIDDIALAVNYNRRHVDRIVAKFKTDLDENYPVAK